jgi:UTP--glucose-1-phosphate uridylyltransferase
VTVRKAVVPAAGLGTRFLPATKSQPKEMIPVVDKPGIQYVVEEAAAARIDDVLVVTSRGKGSMEDHFDRSLELEAHLEKSGKEEELAAVRGVSELARVHTVRQKEPLGFGHAVSVARQHVGDEPFAVLVPDEIVPAPPPGQISLLQRMIEIYERTGSSVIVVQEVSREDIPGYGVVAPEFVEDGLARIVDMVEKPAIDDAPSNLASRGRYLFTPRIFEALEETPPGVGNEIQLTDAIKLLAKRETVYAYVHPGEMFDVGKKLDYLRATVRLALRRDDLAEPFREFLLEIAAEKE